MKLSREWVASLALKWAQKPKRVSEIATKINAKLDLPAFTEPEEQLIFEASVGSAIAACIATLEGKPILQAISKRDTTIACLELLAERAEDAAGPELDVEGIPEWLETWGFGKLAEFIRSTVIPWAQDAAVLQ